MLITKYLTVCLFTWTLPFTLADDDDSADAVCKRLHASDNLSKSPIFCIGRLSKSLLVVTKDHLVFDLPVTSLNKTINSLYLGKQAPIPWEKKWPKLMSNAQYKTVKNQIFECITVRDKASDYITLVTWHKKTNQRGVSVDLKHGNVFLGYKYKDNDDKTRWISSGDINRFYELSNKAAAGLVIRDNQFCTQRDASNIHGVPCTDFPHCNLYAPNCIAETPERYPICKSGDRGLYIDFKKGTSCQPVQWDVWNGFVDEGKFYLFAADAVYSFPESAYTRPNSPVTVSVVPFKDFIQCGGNPYGRDMDVTKKSPVAFGLIIAIVLVLVLLCLCCLLCIIREAIAKKRKKKSSKGRDKSSFVSRALTPFTGGTKRSAGGLGFAALTGKAGGTKRSRAGRKSLEAKSLTRKGASGAGGGSKRSRGIPVPGSLTRKMNRGGSSKRSTAISGPHSVSQKSHSKKTRRSVRDSASRNTKLSSKRPSTSAATSKSSKSKKSRKSRSNRATARSKGGGHK